jgi:hypothetical protein
MNKNTGALLKDIRNIKRNTSMFPSPQDIITSAKELKKIKSTQQINVNTFMDVLIKIIQRIKMKKSRTLIKSSKFIKIKLTKIIR